MPNRTATIDGALAALFAAGCAWMSYVSVAAARSATATYGRNVDSGALEFAAACLYLGPVAVLFAAASMAACRGWRFRRVLHWIAVLAAAAPLAWAVIGSNAPR